MADRAGCCKPCRDLVARISPWVRERQEQAEADVRRTWARAPVLLLESIPGPSDETTGTQKSGVYAREVM